jgi:thiosulfate/3-mercaptopyruvate sulfurtransferase
MTSRTPPFGPLIAVEEAAALLGDPRVRFADTRWYLAKPGGGRIAYDAGHLPGAIFLDLDADLSAPTRADGVGGRHPLPDPPALAARLAAVGFDDSALVIAYDDTGGSVAARLWWMLDDLGFRNVAVLDGGITAWVAAGLPVTTDVTTFPAGTLHLAAGWTRRIERDALRWKLGSVRLLDARPGARYRGEVEPVDAYPGHIATAISAPTDGNLGAGSRFQGADALRERYAALGADTGNVVVSCGSGVSATHNALAMRVAGLPDPVLYDGSWSDWSRSGLPGITGAEPGSPDQARTPD